MHLENLSKIEFILLYKLHLNPIEMDKMDFYRIEYLLNNFEKALEDEDKHYKNKQKEYEKQNKSPDFKMPNITTPNFGGFNVPKIKTPSF